MSVARLLQSNTLEAFDRLREQLGVHVQAHGGDVAVLFCTDHVSHSAYLQVAHGDLVSRTEV